jgi:pyroglutamyl-peptidase
MKKILVTGFTPFGKIRVNPSQLVLEKLATDNARSARRYEVVTGLLPVEYARATAQMKRLLRREHPDAVVCLGVAGGRKDICLERIALNLDDEPLADNAGVVRRDRAIAPAGPPLYRSTLPLANLLKSLQAAHIRARISNHAGTYLCNHIFYVARHATDCQATPTGFIHLPPLPTKLNPGMSLATMHRAVRLCLDTLANHQK